MNKNSIIEYFERSARDRQKWNRRNRYYHQELERYFKFLIPKGSSVLELGCGTGELLDVVSPSRGVGIDFSSEMIKIAKAKFPHLDFRVEDAEDLKIEQKFDYVILSDLIGSLLDVQRAFVQLKKVSTAKTRVIVTYYSYLWEPVLKLAQKLKLKAPSPLQSWLSLADIENLLNLSDFEVIKKGCRFLMPIYIPFISTFFNRIIANLPLLNKLSLTEVIIARPKPSGANRDYSCSVIIACRNEKENICPNIERMPRLGKHTEIIFIEGHSKDGTLEEIKKQIKVFPDRDMKVLVQDGIGKADAIRKGIAHAQGDILMIFDADLTISPEELRKFYDVLASGKAEFVMGSRLVYPRAEGAMRFLNLLGNKFFSSVFSYLLGQRIKDTLCANKALFKSDYLKIKNVHSLFGGDFDPFGDFELIFGASVYNLKIIEIPIRYSARTYGSTQISRFRHGWLLWKMSWIALRKLRMI